jgi:mRNA-degrading endonuclease RelE of RelBE toxin-antitoxin system
MVYEIFFADETNEHLAALSAGQKARVLEAITRQLLHEPARRTRNRKPMDPDKRAFVAPWELRAGNLRVYYAVDDVPSPKVVIVAVGVKVRERLLIGGKDVES